MREAWLSGYGRIEWDTARSLLDGCSCTWSDVNGVQLTEQPPAEAPIGVTHLWGWAPDYLARVRFDTGPALAPGSWVYVAILGDTPVPKAPLREPVMYVERPVRLWAEDDERTGPLPASIRERSWQLREVAGASPVTFLRVKE